MVIDVVRIFKGEEYTIGKMSINGVHFCDTLEDKVREIAKDGKGKIRGVTAIPAGEYDVAVTYSPRMKRLLPYLKNVPHFEGIRIHAGNTAKDTEGCLLVGFNTIKGKLTDSRKTENKITERLLAAQNAGEEIKIVIR